MINELFDTMLDSNHSLINITCVVLLFFLVARKRTDFSYLDAFFVFAFITIHFSEWLYLLIFEKGKSDVISNQGA